MWIKKFKNDIRDYIVQEKIVEVGDIEIPSIYETQTDYKLSQKYEIVLMRHVDEKNGDTKFFWYDEDKKAEVSPRFVNRQLAEMWIKEKEEKYQGV